eukprot:12168568-Heterocapsa_arctica.AAC.1
MIRAVAAGQREPRPLLQEQRRRARCAGPLPRAGMHWSTSRVETEEGCQGVSLRVLGVYSVNSQTC